MTLLLVDVKDPSLTARLMKILARIKNTDTTSVRGRRNVANGLATSEGQPILKGFDFNGNAKLNAILLADHQLNTTTGEISITDLNPLQQLNTPSGATHVGFTSGVLKLNFETAEKELQFSNEVDTPINNTPVSISAIPASMPTGTGQTVYLFKMSFYQEINGTQYALNNGSYNVLHILEIT